MKKLNVNIETKMSVELPKEMQDEEILEFTTKYRHKVIKEARENGAKANVVFELIED